MKKNLPISITIEGIDGAGKSTQVLYLAERLSKIGLKAGVFRYKAKRMGLIGRIIKGFYHSAYGGNPILQLLSQSRVLQESLYALQAFRNMKDLGD